jgi:hypothetical protein
VFQLKVDCGNGVLSYGRRRREAVAEEDEDEDKPEVDSSELPEGVAEKFVFDPVLGQEVIVQNTPLRKQIRVETGTKVDEFKEPTVHKAGNGSTLTIIISFNPANLLCFR